MLIFTQAFRRAKELKKRDMLDRAQFQHKALFRLGSQSKNPDRALEILLALLVENNPTRGKGETS